MDDEERRWGDQTPEPTWEEIQEHQEQYEQMMIRVAVFVENEIYALEGQVSQDDLECIMEQVQEAKVISHRDMDNTLSGICSYAIQFNQDQRKKQRLLKRSFFAAANIITGA